MKAGTVTTLTLTSWPLCFYSGVSYHDQCINMYGIVAFLIVAPLEHILYCTDNGTLRPSLFLFPNDIPTSL